MQTVEREEGETLRDFVLRHAAGRGWRTQRHVAVMCGLDESSLSRFLAGEQDIGAWRTHALFRAAGVPMAEYDRAYALLGEAQATARLVRTARGAMSRRVAPLQSRGEVPGTLLDTSRTFEPDSPELPASVVVALFASRRWTGAEIDAFFQSPPGNPYPLTPSSTRRGERSGRTTTP